VPVAALAGLGERGDDRLAVQHDAEELAVGGRHIAVAQLALLPCLAHRPDERAAVQRHLAAVIREARTDQGPAEVRRRGGALPPAGRLEVGQFARALFEPILRFAVAQDVEVALGGLGQPEHTARVPLVRAGVVRQRVVAVPAEPDVGEPPFAPRVLNAQRQVVVRRPDLAVLAVHACGEQGDAVTEGGQERGEGAVEFVAETAAPGADDLVDQGAGLRHDVLAEVDRQVLERHGPQVAQLQPAQRLRVRDPAPPPCPRPPPSPDGGHSAPMCFRYDSARCDSMGPLSPVVGPRVIVLKGGNGLRPGRWTDGPDCRRGGAGM
jgi:hypothetical protein